VFASGWRPPMPRTKVNHPVRHRRAGFSKHKRSPFQSGRYTQNQRAGHQRQRPAWAAVAPVRDASPDPPLGSFPDDVSRETSSEA